MQYQFGNHPVRILIIRPLGYRLRDCVLTVTQWDDASVEENTIR